jgi:NADPH:quinone reductase-like Zn-dependent oxidoreductase
VRAAQIAELGATPEVIELEGDGAIEIRAVALDPIDIAVGTGRFYGGHPPLPYVPGNEAIGVVAGKRLHLHGDGRGLTKDGFIAQRVDFPEHLGAPVPDELEDAVAAACGVAGLAGWMPFAVRAPVEPDDRVLVLGATGMVGRVAVQAARLLGAARVVAVGRDEQRLQRALALGADETVELGGDDFVDRVRAACGGDGPTLVLDPLWGEPARLVSEAAAPRARIVHMGQSAGPEATLASSVVRSKELSILGYSNFRLTPDERIAAYGDLVAHVAAGRIQVDVETFPLDRVGDAWAAQQNGVKAVVVF